MQEEHRLLAINESFLLSLDRPKHAKITRSVLQNDRTSHHKNGVDADHEEERQKHERYAEGVGNGRNYLMRGGDGRQAPQMLNTKANQRNDRQRFKFQVGVLVSERRSNHVWERD